MVLLPVVFSLAIGAQSASAKPIQALKAEADQLYRKKKFAEASGKFRQALALDSTDIRLVSDFALCLQKAGKKDSAIEMNRRAIRLSVNWGSTGEVVEAALGKTQVRKDSYYNLYKLGVTLSDSFPENRWAKSKKTSGCGKTASVFKAYDQSHTNGYEGGYLEMSTLMITGTPIPAADSGEQYGMASADAEDFKQEMKVRESQLAFEDTARIPIALQGGHFRQGRGICEEREESEGHEEAKEPEGPCNPEEEHDTNEGETRDCALVYLDACLGLIGLACSGSEFSSIDEKETRVPFPFVIQERYFKPAR